MEQRAMSRRDAQAALLLRMSQSRDALREANAIALIQRRQRGRLATSATGAALALANAPHVMFVLALCVGTLTFCPSRALRIIARAGVSAWVAGSAKRVARR